MELGGSPAELGRSRRSLTGRRVGPFVFFISLFLPSLLPPGSNAVAQPQPGIDDDATNSPFNLAPRPLRQLYQEARKCVPEKRFSEAVRLLGRILDYQETPEDFFFQAKGDDPVVRSLKSEAQQLIGELPPDGREAYELEYGTRARRMLEEAVERGGTTGLAAVSRQFFHTRAGYEATYLLGTAEMEQGHPLAAALCLRRLRDTPAAAAEFGPNLLLKLAVCWARAGLTEPAVETLGTLNDSYPDAELIVAGRPQKPPVSSAQALSWLEHALGAPVGPTPAAGAEQWAMYRGGPARNATSLGSSPLLNRRWEVPNANDPHVEKLLSQLRESFLEDGGRVLPGLHPLAVRDYVFMRSVAGLEAVDFRTGKRIWYAPVDKAVDDLLYSDGSAGSVAGTGPVGGAASPEANTLVNWLEQRVWDDAVYGALASDGELVFCVEDLDIQHPTAPMGGFQQRQRWIINNGGFQQTSTTRSYNRLAAYEIATEGKLKWSVGGQTGDGQLPLAGSFFLGPPLPLAGKLYVLAEIKGEIRLFALDPRNDGRLEWSQQLAAVPVGVQEDPLRRFAGATPSYAEGILVCPTSAGAAVAIDLATRSLLWGYQYPRAVDPMFQNRVLRMQGFAGDDLGDNDHWCDASVTIAAGHVLLTPIESRHLHCLNLLDGKLLWQEPRDDGLYVACVADDKALVVGRRGLRTYGLADGKSAWPTPTLNLPDGSAPSGRGFFNGERYYLPLTSAEVAAIDVGAGRIVARSKSRGGTVPGNLICYQGAVISQGVESLESFHQLEDLRRQVAAVLAQHPDDAEALARQGELLLDEGRLDESVAQLRRSFEIKPEPRTRELLIDALLEGLRLDFAAHRRHLDEIERLTESPSSRAAYLRLLATGLQQAGEIEAALAAYLRLVDLGSPGNVLERLDGGLSVRRDRWVRARLAGLREAAKPDELARLDSVLAARLDAADAAADPAALREFLAYFGGHPLADAARARLAAKLIESDALLEAERLLRESERSSDPGRARAAVARLAELLARAGRDDDAACYYRRLAGDWADKVCLDGKTGRQLIDDLPADGAVKRRLSDAWLWPTGQVNKQDQVGQSPNGNRYVPIEVRGRTRPLGSRASVEYDQNNPALVGRDGLGHERWRVSLRDRNEIANGGFPMISHAREDGHLLLVSTGLQLLAIDTLGAPGQAGPRVLWTQDLGESPNTMAVAMPVQVRMNMRQMNVWGGMARASSAGATGPTVAGCVFFQRRRILSAVDPLTGETYWTRRDFPAGCDLFGDEDLLLVVQPNATEAVVLRAMDGYELGRRQVPRIDERLAGVGRMLLVWGLADAGGKASLRLFDPWTQTDVWQRPFDPDAQKTLVGGEAIGVLEKSGHFTLLSLADGKATIDAQVDPEPLMHEIHLLRGETHDLLITNRPAKQRNVQFQVPGMMGSSLINGIVHGFDRATGSKAFSTPIENKILALNQPADLPVLLFTSFPRPAAPGNPAQGSLLCLDKRNGRILFDDMQAQPGGAEMEGDPARREVLIRAPRASIKLEFTDQPYPDDKPGEARGA
ncbi:MAG TPA: PQQ-binding-like beta-propeller repeat protein [Pirellulales bacterium]|nr:PQQ-binding-like beta-propeller repeat protein [Pirellulales bacterium]